MIQRSFARAAKAALLAALIAVILCVLPARDAMAAGWPSNAELTCVMEGKAYVPMVKFINAKPQGSLWTAKTKTAQMPKYLYIRPDMGRGGLNYKIDCQVTVYNKSGNIQGTSTMYTDTPRYISTKGALKGYVETSKEALGYTSKSGKRILYDVPVLRVNLKGMTRPTKSNIKNAKGAPRVFATVKMLCYQGNGKGGYGKTPVKTKTVRFYYAGVYMMPSGS